MPQTTIDSPTAPAGIRLLLIALLPALVLFLYLDGQVYQSDLVDLRFQNEAGGSVAKIFPDRISGLERMGQIRAYAKDNLYEYINGHAEYIIGAGFRGLMVAEFGASGDKQPRLVVNLYDMGKPLNAFGVLVDEASDRKAVSVGSMGFSSGQGLSFIHGPFYVQLSLFDNAGVSALSAARGMEAALKQVVDQEDLAFRFPDFGAVKGTRYVREYYRGMDFLNRVLERTFDRNGTELQAFMVSATPDQLAVLKVALDGFLADEGISVETLEQNGLVYYQVADSYEGEWFYLFSKNQFLGVYSALDQSLMADIGRFVQSVEQDSNSASAGLKIEE